MAVSWIRGLIFLALATASAAIPSSLRDHLRTVRRMRVESVSIGEGAAEKYFCEQVQDHFSTGAKKHWCQRYFANATQYRNGSGPVFLCVGGEGPPLTGNVLSSSVHCNDMVELASQLGAMMFAVEHRFYGKSIPGVPDFSTKNLRLLSSQQALADLAEFHRFATEKYKLQGAKWITFGGSYPGMLAGFARFIYPDIFYAAVSSSAPVQAIVDYRGYNDVVAQSFAQPRVGGSVACAAALAQGHMAIGSLLKEAASRRALEKQFNLCGKQVLDDPRSAALWAGQGVLGVEVQENDPACSGDYCNISAACEALVNSGKHGGDILETFATIAKTLNGPGECTDVDYNGFLEELTNTTLEGGVGRIWFYQTCNEFGFYQTCEEGSDCPYAQGINTLDFNLAQCWEAFNISSDQVSENVKHTNEFYGGASPNSTRVLFPNGQVDPWHYQSVLVSPGPQLPTLWVPGDSHHYWTRPSQPSNSLEDSRAKQEIWKQVTYWLTDALIENNQPVLHI